MSLGCQLIGLLVQQVSTERALAVLELLPPTPEVLCAALSALGKKGSARGVAAVMEVAQRRRQLEGPDSRPLWLATLRAQGRMGAVVAARRTFQAM